MLRLQALVLLLSLALCRAGYVDSALGWCNSHCGSCSSATQCDKYIADCAHFTMQCIIAGGCGPAGVEISSPVYSFTHYKNQYDLAWVDSAQGTVYGGEGGLGDYLRDKGWKCMCGPKCAGKGSCSGVGAPAGCVVLGDAGLGGWSHASFAIGGGKVNAHSNEHCGISISSLYRSVQAIMCPPESCLPTCTAASCSAPVCQSAKCDANGECDRSNVATDDRCTAPVCHAAHCAGGDCKVATAATDSRCPATPQALCQVQGCVGGTCKQNIFVSTDARCSGKAANPATPVHDQECYDWVCTGGNCLWTFFDTNTCTKYDVPAGTRPHDPQCWRPDCAGGVCTGSAVDVDHNSCPRPIINGQAVSPYCYIPKCAVAGGALTGWCDTTVITSPGGLPAGVHLGNCPIPPQFDQQCYWPYCDSNGQCGGDIFVGKPYTLAGNWTDGTQGVRPFDYVISTIPYDAAGHLTLPGNDFCTVGMTGDAGNTKYPTWNAQCVMPRCLSTGKCGVDTVNYGFPCTPIDGRATGGYNEVFVGSPNWPGVVPECVFYTCGEVAGEYGHCIQRNLAGNRTHFCENRDDDLCTYDWCDGLGMCKDHEWKEGRSPEGVCVVDHCDPATGEWTYTRNGDACCGNDEINTGEDCEIGLSGADSLCCVDCYKQTTCDDGNVCTDEACNSANACVRTLNPANAPKCPPLDIAIPDNMCKMVICAASEDPTKVAECQAIADDSKEGTACADSDPNDPCSVYVCHAGTCTKAATNLDQPCTDSTVPTDRPECTKYVCKASTTTTGGACTAVPNVSAPCDDSDKCTTNVCTDVNGVGTCVVTSNVQCTASGNDCMAPPVCDPASGECVSLPLNGVACTMPSDYVAHPGDPCKMFLCLAGNCMRSEDDCPCGNGRIDLGETCDWSMSAYASCCSINCTGCLCGNGRIDAGEQCDFGIPSQIGCCNATCGGCLCGNGHLDAGEECDPGINSDADCCNDQCQGCLLSSRFNRVAAGAAVGTMALVVGLVAAAIAAVLVSRAASGPVLAGASSEHAAGAGHTNPLYSATGPQTNPLYSGAL